MTIGDLESKIGPPILSERSPDGTLIDKTYRGDHYYVQAVQDTSETVKLFTVTSCDLGFRPAFETPSGQTVVLQESTFAGVSEPGATMPSYFLSGATAPSYFFESTYDGNPGLYKTWIVGVNMSCEWKNEPGYPGPQPPFDVRPGTNNRVVFDTLDGSGEATFQEWQNLPQVSAFRSATHINTYAETDVATDLGELWSALVRAPNVDSARFMPGPDPIRVRTLPGDR